MEGPAGLNSVRKWTDLELEYDRSRCGSGL